MIRYRSLNHRRETVTIAGNLMLAPIVVAMRLPMLAVEARSASPWPTETILTLTEKTAAVAEGLFAAQMAFIQSGLRFWPEVLSGRTPSVLNGVAVECSVNAALKPASRLVKANFRRLTRDRKS
jgi:hypothetical protein